MKTLTKLSLLIACLIQVSPGFSFFQAEKTHVSQDRHYVSFDQLLLSKEGAFLKGTGNKLHPLKELHYDSEGYYLAGFFEDLVREAFRPGNYTATCDSCGAEFYNSAPSTCPNCGEEYDDHMNITEFDPDSGSYWDRA